MPLTLLEGRGGCGSAGELESGDRRTDEWDHGDERRQADRTGEGPRPGAETTGLSDCWSGHARGG